MKQVEPDLLPRHAHRALLYIERLNAVEVFPTADAVESLASSEGPRAAVYGNPWLGTLSSAVALWAGRGEQLREAEPVVDWLVRMSWLTTTPGGGLRLTDLGAALLAGLRETPSRYLASDQAPETAAVLRPGDPLVYATLTRAIAAAGPGMLVDPYFKSDMLPWLHDSTLLTRLLIKDGGAQARELPLVAMTLHAMKDSAYAGRVEIRVTRSPELHDRLVIPDSGDVLNLGTSITGIGQHLSTVMPLPRIAADALRAAYEGLWQGADVVIPMPLRRPASELAIDPQAAVPHPDPSESR